MPELPEVETIARTLQNGTTSQPALPGQIIKDVCLLWERTLADPNPHIFISRLINKTIAQVSRRGKFIVIKLDDVSILIHLRMSGDLRVENHYGDDHNPLPLLKHDRLIIIFIDNHRLVFNDTRKFGRVWLVDDPSKILSNLGPEPLDKCLTPDDFHQRLHSHKRQLKPLLMDQRFLAGLGNIYTDEALHLAGLHPLMLSSHITLEQGKKLFESIRSVLNQGIQMDGASIDWVYRGGSFQNNFHVYQRTGEPCGKCGSVIERIIVGQRSTHVCPKCQRLL